MGLDTDLQETLVHKYISITDTPMELYASLLAKVSEWYQLRQNVTHSSTTTIHSLYS